MVKEPGPELVNEKPAQAPRVNPGSNAWLPYYQLAEESARTREAERARLTEKAQFAGRVLTISVLAIVGLCYALFR